MGRAIAIIGSGHSGLCLGMKLKEAGFRDFTILEKADRIGGTWRDNTYPGAACDSPAFTYCFSFEQKTDWSRKWAPQEEILSYMERCVDARGLRPHIRTGTEVTSARFDDEARRWRIRTRAGEELSADVLVSAVGQLSRPHVPAIPGLETFAGDLFHSARWDHGCELAGRDVAVVGNAASAVQIVPEIAPRVRRLRVFQRSANWLFPKNDRLYAAWEKALFGRVPGLARLYRWWLWLQHEIRLPVIHQQPHLTRWATRIAHEHLRAQVADPELRRALIPDYPIGGKRLLITDDYYPALQRENVELVTDPIDHLTPEALVTRSGSRHPAEVVILATGFEATRFLAPIEVAGRGGLSLAEAWRDGAEAYLGLTVAGFPNFFMMYGPNTNLGHNSILFMIECQTRYILDCLRQMDQRDLAALDLRPGRQDAYNKALRAELARTAWARVGRSWYRDERGRITQNWPGSTVRYWWRTRRADLGDYRLEPRRQLSARRGRRSSRSRPRGRGRGALRRASRG